MKHEESRIQQQCVAWFRAQYPAYSMLLVHPINEGSGHSRTDRMRQTIHKAEGAVAGVSDLLFFIPSKTYHGLCLEFKTAKGKQSQAQKDFQQMMESAGHKYVIVKRFEEFQAQMRDYMDDVMGSRLRYIAEAYSAIVSASEEREREKFYKALKSF